MKTRSIMDGDLGFTLHETDDGTFAIDLTVVAGVVTGEPATVYASPSKRDARIVFRALSDGLVSGAESAVMTTVLRMADEEEDVPRFSSGERAPVDMMR